MVCLNTYHSSNQGWESRTIFARFTPLKSVQTGRHSQGASRIHSKLLFRLFAKASADLGPTFKSRSTGFLKWSLPYKMASEPSPYCIVVVLDQPCRVLFHWLSSPNAHCYYRSNVACYPLKMTYFGTKSLGSILYNLTLTSKHFSFSSNYSGCRLLLDIPYPEGLECSSFCSCYR